jgi:hypothetical protein
VLDSKNRLFSAFEKCLEVAAALRYSFAINTIKTNR